MGLETITVAETAYRYSSYDTPFWARPNSQPGRWHSDGDGPTQYLAMSTNAAWAELIRNEELTTEEEVALVSIKMWAVQIERALLVDYSTFEKADAAGFDPEALIDDDHSRAQVEGARLRAAGYHGVLAPSAALPGDINLTLFGPRTLTSWGRPGLLASAMPATVIAKGSPPTGLLPGVRHYGKPHREFAAYHARVRRSGTSD